MPIDLLAEWRRLTDHLTDDQRARVLDRLTEAAQAMDGGDHALLDRPAQPLAGAR